LRYSVVRDDSRVTRHKKPPTHLCALTAEAKHLLHTTMTQNNGLLNTSIYVFQFKFSCYIQIIYANCCWLNSQRSNVKVT